MNIEENDFNKAVLALCRQIGIAKHDLPLTHDELHRKLHDRGLSPEQREELKAGLVKMGALQ